MNEDKEQIYIELIIASIVSGIVFYLAYQLILLL